MFPALTSLGLGLTGGSAGPSGANSDNVFNSSGWNVATRGSSAGGLNPYLIGGIVLAVTLVALVWAKRK